MARSKIGAASRACKGMSKTERRSCMSDILSGKKSARKARRKTRRSRRSRK